ncbi:MAG TPA: hypothetical protein VGO26_08765 [Amnibacterium sp.]|nr:hypothetical protein [Amnibacterium sp.]
MSGSAPEPNSGCSGRPSASDVNGVGSTSCATSASTRAAAPPLTSPMTRGAMPRRCRSAAITSSTATATATSSQPFVPVCSDRPGTMARASTASIAGRGARRPTATASTSTAAVAAPTAMSSRMPADGAAGTESV